MITGIDKSFASATGQASHAEWVSSEMTRRMLEEARKFVRPASIGPQPNSTLGEQALLNYGVQLGMEAVLDFLTRTPVYAAAAQAMEQSEELQADFGAREILKAMGYDIKTKEERQ